MAMLKMAAADDGMGFADYMNTEKALSVIMAIFVSVAIAFVFGFLIQYITRILFTFNFRKNLTWKIGIFGGIALTAIVYFMLIKGVKDLSFMTAEAKAWVNDNTWMLLLICFIGFTILMQVLHFCKVNVFKVIVLVGTFSLATAFAGNDLVNFIGVPLAGYSSYVDYMAAGGGDPDGHLMGVLNEPASTPVVFLFCAGLVMVIALATSKKAHNVTKTEIGLSRQDEGDEMFGSSKVARSLVRWSNVTAEKVIAITPGRVRNWINNRFDETQICKEDGAAYDLVRASVNLMVASMLIALGTSLKLPLSTTYVTFMVAMSTSLADRAWSRESAVFRVTGMLSVIGGWFVTAGVAFAGAFILALLMHFGGTVLTVILVIAGLAALIHSNVTYKAKDDANGSDKAFAAIVTCKDSKSVWGLFSRYVASHEADFLNRLAGRYVRITNGLFSENIKTLRRTADELRKEKTTLKNLRRKETICLRRVDTETAMTKSAWFHMIFNNMEQMYYSLRRICEPAYEHVDNHFSPIPQNYVDEFCKSRDKLSEVIEGMATACGEGRFNDLRNYDYTLPALQTEFSDLRKALMEDIQKKNLNLTVAYLYLNLIQESEQLAIELTQMSRAARKFQLG